MNIVRLVKYVSDPARWDRGKIVSCIQGREDLVLNGEGWGAGIDAMVVQETPSALEMMVDLSGAAPQLVPRPEHPGPSKTQIVADGEDAAVISDITAGAHVRVMRPVLGPVNVVADGTDLEVVSEHPGMLVVTIEGCWPWRPIRFEIEAVAL